MGTNCSCPVIRTMLRHRLIGASAGLSAFHFLCGEGSSCVPSSVKEIKLEKRGRTQEQSAQCSSYVMPILHRHALWYLFSGEGSNSIPSPVKQIQTPQSKHIANDDEDECEVVAEYATNHQQAHDIVNDIYRHAENFMYERGMVMHTSAAIVLVAFRHLYRKWSVLNAACNTAGSEWSPYCQSSSCIQGITGELRRRAVTGEHPTAGTYPGFPAAEPPSRVCLLPPVSDVPDFLWHSLKLPPFSLSPAGNWAFRGTEDIATSFGTFRRQGLAHLHRRFRAGSDSAFHASQEKIGIFWMRLICQKHKCQEKLGNFQEKSGMSCRHFFVAFLSFYALKSLIDRKK